MKRNFDDENDNGPYDPRYPGRKVVADGGRVRVPLMLMDSASGRKSEGVRLRDESHALMVDRMRNPKNFDPLSGRRIVDGVIDDLSAQDVYELAKRLAPVLAIGMPKFAPGHPDEADEDNGMERQDRDNRHPHYKPVRDQAMATKLRDEAYAEMVDRMKNPKAYSHLTGRRI
jgi:hypothetical protein